jgi:hypothetical protein
MPDFDDLSAPELEALKSLSEGKSFDLIPPEIVQSLADKNLLEDFQGSYIVPALVWYRLQKSKL